MGARGSVVCLLPALAAISCARHYRVDGMVLRIEPERRTVTVSHRDIQGYMPAMVMPFRVRRAEELTGLEPGARVHFQLVVGRHDAYARQLRMTRTGAESLTDSSAPLRLPQPAARLRVGEPVPDFRLADQLGRVVRLTDFRGRVVVLNFIYTRCPLPDVCPRLSANFARLQRRFHDRMARDLMLVSISLDPQYDSTEVLARYGKIWGANPEGWRFLTGDTAEVRRVAERFGMVYWAEEGMLAHTSDTGIVSRDGRLAAIVEGSGYAVSQLGDLIAQEMETGR
jgi:protein SCO1/2